jgi:hypothetical protein
MYGHPTRMTIHTDGTVAARRDDDTTPRNRFSKTHVIIALVVVGIVVFLYRPRVRTGGVKRLPRALSSADGGSVSFV